MCLWKYQLTRRLSGKKQNIVQLCNSLCAWRGQVIPGVEKQWRYAMAPCWWALLAGGGELETLRATANAGSLPYCAFTSTIEWDLVCYCNTQPLGNL